MSVEPSAFWDRTLEQSNAHLQQRTFDLEADSAAAGDEGGAFGEKCDGEGEEEEEGEDAHKDKGRDETHSEFSDRPGKVADDGDEYESSDEDDDAAYHIRLSSQPSPFSIQGFKVSHQHPYKNMQSAEGEVERRIVVSV